MGWRCGCRRPAPLPSLPAPRLQVADERGRSGGRTAEGTPLLRLQRHHGQPPGLQRAAEHLEGYRGWRLGRQGRRPPGMSGAPTAQPARTRVCAPATATACATACACACACACARAHIHLDAEHAAGVHVGALAARGLAPDGPLVRVQGVRDLRQVHLREEGALRRAGGGTGAGCLGVSELCRHGPGPAVWRPRCGAPGAVPGAGAAGAPPAAALACSSVLTLCTPQSAALCFSW